MADENTSRFARTDISHEVEKMIHEIGKLPSGKRFLTYDALAAIGVDVRNNMSHRQMVSRAFDYAHWDFKTIPNYGYKLSEAGTVPEHAGHRWRRAQSALRKTAKAIDNLMEQHRAELPESYAMQLERSGQIAGQLAATSVRERKAIVAAPSEMYLGAAPQEKK